jgi:hypothetical protein
MLTVTHAHHRPDMITRTSVIEPYAVQQGPVAIARATVTPFIDAVYGRQPPSMAGFGAAGTRAVMTNARGVQVAPTPHPASQARARVMAQYPRGAGVVAAFPSGGNVVATATHAAGQQNRSVFRAMQAQQAAYARGSIWQQTRARQSLSRISLPWLHVLRSVLGF